MVETYIDENSLNNWKIQKSLYSNTYTNIDLAIRGQEIAIIKSLKKEYCIESDKRRFAKEIEIYEKFNNQLTFTPKLIDSSSNLDKSPWFAIEHISGLNLQDFVVTNGVLPDNKWWDLSLQLFKALNEIHATGIVHKDIKPQNIMISGDNHYVIDFGFAQEINGENLDIEDLDWVGTHPYSSPEHYSDENVPEMDIFSAASTLVFAAKGESPFRLTEDLNWMDLITSGVPDLTQLNDKQIIFLSPLFSISKSTRPRASKAIEVLNKIQHLKTNSKKELSDLDWSLKNLSEVKIDEKIDLQKIANSIPDPNDLLFNRNRHYNRFKKFLKYSTALVIVFALTTLIYLGLKSFLDSRSIAEDQSQLFKCVQNIYSLNYQTPKKEIDDVLDSCDKNVDLKNADYYLALSQLYKFKDDILEVHKNLILASQKNHKFIDHLIGFYKLNMSWEYMGKDWATPCSENPQESYCKIVLARYYSSINDIPKAEGYLRKAALTKDTYSIILYNNLMQFQDKPYDFLDEINLAASDGNIDALTWLLRESILSSSGDKNYDELLQNKFLINSGYIDILEATKLLADKKSQSALERINSCIRKKSSLEGACIFLKSELLRVEFKEPATEYLPLIELAAFKGDTQAFVVLADQLLSKDKQQFKKARDFYQLAADKTDYEAQVKLANTFLYEGNTVRACNLWDQLMIDVDFRSRLSVLNDEESANWETKVGGDSSTYGVSDWIAFHDARKQIQKNWSVCKNYTKSGYFKLI